MITIFTTTKPMKGCDKINQANAIGSWLTMPQRPQVIVFTTAKESHYFETMGATVITSHRCNGRGTPFLDSMFTLTETNALYPYIMYANADILLFDDIYQAVRVAVEHKPEFFIVGNLHCVTTPAEPGPSLILPVRTTSSLQSPSLCVCPICLWVGWLGIPGWSERPTTCGYRSWMQLLRLWLYTSVMGTTT